MKVFQQRIISVLFTIGLLITSNVSVEASSRDLLKERKNRRYRGRRDISSNKNKQQQEQGQKRQLKDDDWIGYMKKKGSKKKDSDDDFFNFLLSSGFNEGIIWSMIYMLMTYGRTVPTTGLYTNGHVTAFRPTTVTVNQACDTFGEMDIDDMVSLIGDSINNDDDGNIRRHLKNSHDNDSSLNDDHRKLLARMTKHSDIDPEYLWIIGKILCSILSFMSSNCTLQGGNPLSAFLQIACMIFFVPFGNNQLTGIYRGGNVVYHGAGVYPGAGVYSLLDETEEDGSSSSPEVEADTLVTSLAPSPAPSPAPSV